MGDLRWYCYKDDQIWLGEAEQPQTQQAQSTKYCKKCGNKLELEDEFCDKCGSRQKKILAATSTDGQQQIFVDKPQMRPTGLWYLVPFFFGIIGGLVGYVAVKDEDKGMANELLIFGLVMTALFCFVGLGIIFLR